ncbi:MAG: antitoxin VbhA family protein [Bacillota bacterium]
MNKDHKEIIPSEKEIENAMRKARASLELDGFKVTAEMDKLVRSRMLGEITDEEFNREVMNIIKSK